MDMEFKASESFFQNTLHETDSALFQHIRDEQTRQNQQIELIASENIVSLAVLQAQGSVLTNKYAEGYPGRRYYGGCEFVDAVESLAIARAKTLFNAGFANVQPNSGSQANQAVLLALVKPGETLLGLSLDAGGHLTHGARPNLSGKWFQAEQYGLDPKTHRIDMDAVLAKAKQVRPALIIAGGSAYPRAIDFQGFRKIADEVGAKLMVDMAHIAGLVAAGVHENPLPFADVVTTTTHKTLRGPRGGMILTNDEEIARKINSAIFPGLQGGPLMHVIAAKAVAFGEALQPGFKSYAKQVIANCKIMAKQLETGGYSLVSGGTDTHLALVDLRSKGLTGKAAEHALERAFITCNKNGVPGDPEKPTITSGIRIGSPAGTTRGFGEAEFELIGDLMVEVLDALVKNPQGNPDVENSVRERVLQLTGKFPMYRS
ncbi:Serine hydroxymethyltransferase [hydrothermal vent metagenome]|uniref:Serine hydroxymethyltransferase n=1 Tax=hydrothermal vent metagenome TaxID=652676 RepID=A0A3B0RTN3_9ZZZZ